MVDAPNSSRSLPESHFYTEGKIKMTTKRTFMLAAVLALGLAACGDKPAPKPASKAPTPAPKVEAPAPKAEAPVPGNTLKKIADTGVVKIGHRDASIPFSYLDDKQ